MLISKFIRYTNFNYGICNIFYTQLKFIKHIRCPPKLYTVAYLSNISNDSNEISSLLQYFSSSDKFKIQDIERALTNEKLENISQEKRATLLQSCGKSLWNRSLDFRIQLCNIIFQKFVYQNCLTVNDYNVFIKVCTENKENIDSNNFFKSMTCIPNEETFSLLLENVCDRGDINQAHSILSKIKEHKYRIDNRVFNALILAHTINEGEKGAIDVLQMMKLRHIPRNSDTNWNILIGLATRLDQNEFLKALDDILIFNEDYFIKLLLELCLNDKYELIENVKNKLGIDIFPRYFINTLKQLCIHLIHRNKIRASVYIYSTLTEYIGQEEFGRFLLKEILSTEIDSNELISICDYLKRSKTDLYALEYVTDMALKNNKLDKSWLFLEHFDKLRPHYFWPLLLNAGKEHGEIGMSNPIYLRNL